MASTGLGSNQQAGASSGAAATHGRSHQQPQQQQQQQQQQPTLQQALQPKVLQQQEQQQHRGSHALVEAWLLSTATGAETPPSAARPGLPVDPFEQTKQRSAANGAPNPLATERRGTWAHEDAPKAAADAKAPGVVDLFAGQGRPADGARAGAAAVGAPVPAAAAPKQHAGAAPQGYLDLHPPPQQNPLYYQQPSLVASPARPQQQPVQQVLQVAQPQQQQLPPQPQPLQPQPLQQQQQPAAAATWQPGSTEAAELSRPGGVDAPMLPPTDTNAPFSVQWEYLDTKVRLGKGIHTTYEAAVRTGASLSGFAAGAAGACKQLSLSLRK